jgi:hypothetical protein
MTLASAETVAAALDLPLSGLIALAENELSGLPPSVAARAPRRIPGQALRNESALIDLCGLDGRALRAAIEHAYDTLDLLDSELLGRGVEPIAGLVELANFSSMMGNLLGAGLANASSGLYVRNRPHAFPDLIPQRPNLPELELKMALEKNSPKGHLPKEGVYITFRYVLGGADGAYERGATNRGQTAWIWEVRAGRLGKEDFSISNTSGDSGKTAVIRSSAFKTMTLVLLEERFLPYAHPWGY